MRPKKSSVALLACTVSCSFLLASCATQPMGPTVQVMPGSNKPFQVFAKEQEECKQYASSQVQGQADAANQKAIGATLLGAGLGAGLGAAVGGGQGAGVGAAGGGIVGTAVGAGHSNNAQQGIQQQYDNAYTQCMYAKGNQVPGMMPQAEAAPAPAPAPTPTPAPTPKPKKAAPPPSPSNAPPPPPSDAPPPPAQ